MEEMEEKKMLITNFDKKNEPLYRKAVEQYVKKELYIDKNAYWKNGHKDENMSALRCTTQMDLSDFWRLFDKLAEGQYGVR